MQFQEQHQQQQHQQQQQQQQQHAAESAGNSANCNTHARPKQGGARGCDFKVGFPVTASLSWQFEYDTTDEVLKGWRALARETDSAIQAA